MPRFFFEVNDHTGRISDSDGQELASLEVARAVATEGIRSLLQSDVRAGFIDVSGHINIQGADRTLLATVRYRDAMTVHWVLARKDQF